MQVSGSGSHCHAGPGGEDHSRPGTVLAMPREVEAAGNGRRDGPNGQARGGSVQPSRGLNAKGTGNGVRREQALLAIEVG